MRLPKILVLTWPAMPSALVQMKRMGGLCARQNSLYATQSAAPAAPVKTTTENCFRKSSGSGCASLIAVTFTAALSSESFTAEASARLRPAATSASVQ